jgi:hypothetical protein
MLAVSASEAAPCRTGLEVDLFWTDTDGQRHRMRRASPYNSKIQTRRWAEELIKDSSVRTLYRNWRHSNN